MIIKIKNIIHKISEDFEIDYDTTTVEQLCLNIIKHFNIDSNIYNNIKLIYDGQIIGLGLLSSYIPNNNNVNILYFPQIIKTENNIPIDNDQLYTLDQVNITCIAFLQFIINNPNLKTLLLRHPLQLQHNLINSNSKNIIKQILSSSNLINNIPDNISTILNTIQPIIFNNTNETKTEEINSSDNMSNVFTNLTTFLQNNMFQTNDNNDLNTVVFNYISPNNNINPDINSNNINSNNIFSNIVSLLSIQLTPEDNENIQYIVNMGFLEENVKNMYIRCNKNIEMTINMLLEN